MIYSLPDISLLCIRITLSRILFHLLLAPFWICRFEFIILRFSSSTINDYSSVSFFLSRWRSDGKLSNMQKLSRRKTVYHRTFNVFHMLIFFCKSFRINEFTNPIAIHRDPWFGKFNTDWLIDLEPHIHDVFDSIPGVRSGTHVYVHQCRTGE